jgi:hypothetical protein
MEKNVFLAKKLTHEALRSKGLAFFGGSHISISSLLSIF